MTEGPAKHLLKPDELRRISDDMESAKVRDAVEKRRKLEEQQEQLRQEFMQREVKDGALERVNDLIRRAAEQGQREVMLFKFPASYCTDHGRAINNFDPDWHESLSGFARKAHEVFVQHLKPSGFKLRAQVLNYPDGNLGDVGIFLGW